MGIYDAKYTRTANSNYLLTETATIGEIKETWLNGNLDFDEISYGVSNHPVMKTGNIFLNHGIASATSDGYIGEYRNDELTECQILASFLVDTYAGGAHTADCIVFNTEQNWYDLTNDRATAHQTYGNKESSVKRVFNDSRIVLDINGNGFDNVYLLASYLKFEEGNTQDVAIYEDSNMWNDAYISAVTTHTILHDIVTDDMADNALINRVENSYLQMMYLIKVGDKLVLATPRSITHQTDCSTSGRRRIIKPYLGNDVNAYHGCGRINPNIPMNAQIHTYLPTIDMPYDCGLDMRSYNGSAYYGFMWLKETMQYLANSSGLYWTGSSITTAGSYRENIRLPYMDKNRVIHHDTWITGIENIKDSDSYNKTMTPQDFPHYKPSEDFDDKDKELEMIIGNIYNAGGLVKYYLLSDSTKLTEVSKAMSDTDIVPTGKDLLPNLISLKRFCVDKSLIGRGTNKTIKIAGVELKDDAKSINAIGETLDSVTGGVDMGTITVTGKFGSETDPHYLDFAPYTELQLYLPLCGWVELPSKCMYKTLSIYYVFDATSGSCIATVKAGETVVATATGSLGVDIPFTATSAGIQFAGKLNGLINGAGSVLTGIAGVATGNPLAIGASILSGAGAITNGITTANKNYTQVTGRTGDVSEWALMNMVYLKISRPILNNPDNFAHTVGNLYCKQATLDELSGYTIVDNPDVSLECTAGELNEIKSLLSSGIYI